jgi:hypothetical protein
VKSSHPVARNAGDRVECTPLKQMRAVSSVGRAVGF